MVSFARPANRSASILVPSHGGHYLLVDIERDLMLDLNRVGADVWRSLCAGQSESEIVEGISKKYEVDKQRVASDVGQLLARIRELRLTPRSNEESCDVPQSIVRDFDLPSYPWYGIDRINRPKPGRVAVLSSILGLAGFDLVLWLFSLKVLCSLVKTWPVIKRNASRPVCGELCSAVEQACVWYPRKAMCLQRSAVATCLLRSYGISAQMIIGVRPVPFLAHAWVEVNGSVLNDFPGVTSMYRAVSSY